MANEIAKKETNELTYNDGVDLASLFAEEMDGQTPTFERIKIPAGGGISFEVPGDDPENPDSVKEIKAVILYHHPINCYYKEEYTGGNNPPDCGSMDGHVGIEAESGEIKNCADCPFNKFGSGHSEAIITDSYQNALSFQQNVDAAAVYVNASTRFTDGNEFGFGAEIGISTQKLHARGPMGLEALTTMKYLIYGEGQIR